MKGPERNYFNSKDIYPETGIYRETIPEVERHAEQLFLTFMEAPRNMQLLNGESKTPLNLTAEESNDITNYVRYATKRLAAASVTSPIKRENAEDLIREKVTGYESSRLHPAFHMAPSSLIGHDILHTMVAYAQSNGKSLMPLYTRVKTSEQQVVDRGSVEEELIVNLWDPAAEGANFLRVLAESNDPLETFNKIRPSARQSSLEEYASDIQHIHSLKESDSLEYAMRTYEAFFLQDHLSFSPPQVADEVKRTMLEIQTNRSPEYLRIFAALYGNLTSEHPDPKIFMHEFLKEVEPLVTRLR